jgi:serine phosphatase RsbU (regulator of sigma subunit)/CheY-like chemotaxis protein
MSEFSKYQRYIIAVDDDAIILNVLINHLKRFLPEDITLIALDNAASALEACHGMVAAESELVLIISDYLMYPMKGSDLLIQVSQIIPKCKKIMLTGQADVKAVADVINNTGLFHFIEKPWYPKDLELTILEAIHAYDNERRLEAQEKELRLLNEDLQNLVNVRTAELAQKNRELLEGLEYAKLIQSAFVPSLEVLSPEIKSTYLYESPLKVISGDFHWVHKTQHYGYILQGDCTGHGLAGALLSVLVIDIAKSYLLSQSDNIDIEAAAQEIIIGLKSKVHIDKLEFLESVGVDFCILKIEFSTNDVQYANFNSNIVLLQNQETEIISKSKGFFRMIAHESEVEIGHFNATNKRIILFSDGLLDLMGGQNNKRIKWVGIEKWILEPGFFDKGPDYLSEKIKNYLGAHEQIDDITLLSLYCE